MQGKFLSTPISKSYLITLEMPKRKAEVIGISPEQARPSKAPKAEQPIQYAYTILEEAGEPHRGAVTEIRGIFTNVEAADNEAKAIARHWNLWKRLKDDGRYHDYGTPLLDPRRDPRWSGKYDNEIQEWLTARGELRIAVAEGQGEYRQMSVIRKRLRATSSYGSRKRGADRRSAIRKAARRPLARLLRST